MSEREQVISLLDKVPDYKIGFILAYIQGTLADEQADDEFCESLLQDFINDPDPHKADGTPLSDCMKEWGLA